ncbi:MAG: hypothetical protein R2874_11965 [Desulfobacterales bacterium]
MKNTYEGATFPHRKIVNSLAERIRENRLAAHFHDDAFKTLCAGCITVRFPDTARMRVLPRPESANGGIGPAPV